MMRKINTRLSPAQRARIAAADARRAEIVAEARPVVVNGCQLLPSQRERLAEAERLAAGRPMDRRRAASLVRQVSAELELAREVRGVEAAIEDSLARARRRGEVFAVEVVDIGDWRRDEDGGLVRRGGQPVLDVQTVRRASRIDGLASAYKAGVIGDGEKQVADACRALFEQARPPVSTSAYGGEGHRSGRRDPGRMLVAVAEAGHAGAVVGRIEAACGDARTFAVLDAVVGRGASLRSLGAGGDLNATNLKRLRAGLAVAKRVLDDERARRKARNGGAGTRGLANQEH